MIKDGDKEKNKEIIAIKNTEQGTSKYIIETQDFDLKSIKEEIEYNTNGDAEFGYRGYEAIKKYERGDIEVTLKGKTVIVNIPIDYFKDKIKYNEDDIRLKITKKNKLQILKL